jgi:chemosensory pili system protein ChpA (sensor histidine kinase/response regulator)
MIEDDSQFDAAPDLSVLSWCAAEIRQSLQDAVDRLRRQLASGGADKAPLREARTSVHQAHGALSIVGLSGVPRVTAEAERFVEAIEGGALALDEAKIELFAGACAAVAEYLEDLLAGEPHQPLHLFPYYRDLLEARGAQRIHPSDLMIVSPPAGDLADPPPVKVTDPAALAAARGGFERSLLKLMRDPGDKAALAVMRAAVDAVLHSERGARQAVFWRSALACFDAWRDGELALDVDAKRLLARINLQIRHTVSDVMPVADRLLAETLFLLARARGDSALVRKVREAFHLDGAIPPDYETRRYGALDPAALDRAREALAASRQTWENLSGGPVGASARLEAAKALVEASGQLPDKGLSGIAAGLLACAHSAASPEREGDELLALEAAGGLLFAEQLLEQGGGLNRIADVEAHAAELGERLKAAARDTASLAPLPEWMRTLGQAAHDRLTMATFVAEARITLDQAEQTLDAFFRNPTSHGELPEAVRRLRQIGGALRLLGHQQAGMAAEAVARQVAGFAQAAELQEQASAVPQADAAQAPGEAPPFGETQPPAFENGLPGATDLLDVRRFEDVAASLGALGFFIDGLLAPEHAGVGVIFDPDTGRIEASVEAASGRRRFDAGLPDEPIALPEVTEADLPAAAAPVSPGAPPAAGTPPVPGGLPPSDRSSALDAAPAEKAAPELAPGVAAGVAPIGAPATAFSPPAAAVSDAAAGAESAGPDPELLDIFLTEAAEILDMIEESATLSRDAPSDPDALTAIRRGFHTLKGSSRMVGLVGVGDAAWAMEKVLNLWLGESRGATAELQDLVELVAAIFRGWVGMLRANPLADVDPAVVVAAAEALADGRATDEALSALVAAGAGLADFEDASTGGHADDTLVGGREKAGAAAAQARPRGAPTSGEFDLPSLELGGAFDLGTLAPATEPMPEPGAVPPATEPMPAAEPISEPEALPQDDEAVPESPPVDDQVRIGSIVLSRQLYEIFLGEADGLLATLKEDLGAWQRTPSRPASEAAQRAMHSLKGSASIVSLDFVHRLAERLEVFLQTQRAGGRALADDDIDDYRRCVAAIESMLHRFAAGREPGEDLAVLAMAAQLAERWTHPPAVAPDAERGASALVSDTTAGDGSLAQAGTPLDQDLLPVFVEEAVDILPDIGDKLRRWQEDPADRALQQLVMRQLHTIKGSARMAGAMVLGQRVHEMETRVEAASGLSVVPAALIEDLIAEHDAVIEMFEAIRESGVEQSVSGVAGSPVPEREPADEALSGSPSFAAAAVAPNERSTAGPLHEQPGEHSTLQVLAPSVAQAAARQALAPTGQVAAGQAPAGQPSPGQPPAGLVRVRADLLDQLVNEAGEVSIARSRVDNELSQLRQALLDLTDNVGRLRTQLREIEIQAESQIQAGDARRRAFEEQFDPLEFDRYTRFQELTRMLAESVDDVATVQQNATRSLDGATQDMIRQTQVLRELQQNLMRMRMVPFGSIADRLYRVVRQAAKELGKRVNLDIRGASAEIDRGVLERMAAPIEHLLRNAVAHGIEPPKARLAAGKPEAGELRLEVRQEGNEVVLAFSDDGVGLDLERIRRKALALGLVDEDVELSVAAAAELIFMAGFSTAGVVNEISGRGVGLDVVRTEVASLGGRIDTDSTPGSGTRFVVHLPLTLAIAQVVLVSAGPLRYAIPSSSVEQVLQFKAQPLADAYAQGGIAWQGERVAMHYLGALVDARELQPVAQHQSPVVVIRSGNQRLAVHVDQVSPTQEVVVKNVGAQVARVRGIGGATVLSNGEIVLILNVVRLAQAVLGDGWSASGREQALARLAALPPTVMVVDDSLTVRKVTQRLLAREGYDVMLAKDGVDALRQLQDRRPDVMLVDIEMPRMDGFDLTRNVRGDERYHDIPIVMITSRTADKHRNHAMSLGVNAYLGKPYRDDELLERLGELARRPAG